MFSKLKNLTLGLALTIGLGLGAALPIAAPAYAQSGWVVVNGIMKFAGSVTISGDLTVSGTCTGCGTPITASNTQVVFRNSSGDYVGDSDLTFLTDTLTATILAAGTGTKATAGAIRLPNNTSIGWRNAANTANKTLYLSAADELQTDTNFRIATGAGIGAFIDGVIIGAGLGSYSIGPAVNPLKLVNFSATSILEIGAGLVFNENGADIDFRAESDGNANMFTVDASVNRVGVGTATPAFGLHVDLTAAANDALFKVNHDTRDYIVISSTSGAEYGYGTNRVQALTSSIKLQVAAVTIVDAISTGATITGNLLVSGEIRAGSANAIYWSGRSVMYSPSDGVIRVANNAETDFNRMQFGGTTSSFPALKRAGVGLLVTNGDDSAPGYFQVGSTALTMTAGAFGLPKMTASASAPGASGVKFEAVCGTNAGTAKLIMYAGTSTTAVTVIDNVGSGVTGC